MADVNTKAFRSLSYGVYIVSTKNKKKLAGCIVNTFQQVTSSPARVSVAVNKENFTCGAIMSAGRFEVSVLDESTPMELIGTFGFKSSAQIDKFAEVAYELDAAGIPYVTEHAIAHVGARVIERVDAGTHFIFIGEVEEAGVLTSEPPMTYAYYHQVKGGKTPPKASSYVADEPEPAKSAMAGAGIAAGVAATTAGREGTGTVRYGWKCSICGYVLEQDELPADFRCPVCGKGPEVFERIEL